MMSGVFSSLEIGNGKRMLLGVSTKQISRWDSLPKHKQANSTSDETENVQIMLLM